MPEKKTVIPETAEQEVEDPPIEPPGVRTDLFEDPDAEALALAASGGGTAYVELSLEDEDPPREQATGLQALQQVAGYEDPPSEWD